MPFWRKSGLRVTLAFPPSPPFVSDDAKVMVSLFCDVIDWDRDGYWHSQQWYGQERQYRGRVTGKGDAPLWDSVVCVTASPGTKVAADRPRRLVAPCARFRARSFVCVASGEAVSRRFLYSQK